MMDLQSAVVAQAIVGRIGHPQTLEDHLRFLVLHDIEMNGEPGGDQECLERAVLIFERIVGEDGDDFDEFARVQGIDMCERAFRREIFYLGGGEL